MTLDQQIAELKREIALRKNVYPKWVANQKMRQSEMDHHIAAMTAALHTVMAVKRLKATMMEHQFIGTGTAMCSCGARAPAVEAFDHWLDHVFERSKAAAEAEAGT